MDLSPPFLFRHRMLRSAASWHGSKYSLFDLLPPMVSVSKHRATGSLHCAWSLVEGSQDEPFELPLGLLAPRVLCVVTLRRHCYPRSALKSAGGFVSLCDRQLELSLKQTAGSQEQPLDFDNWQQLRKANLYGNRSTHSMIPPKSGPMVSRFSLYTLRHSARS